MALPRFAHVVDAHTTFAVGARDARTIIIASRFAFSGAGADVTLHRAIIRALTQSGTHVHHQALLAIATPHWRGASALVAGAAQGCLGRTEPTVAICRAGAGWAAKELAIAVGVALFSRGAVFLTVAAKLALTSVRVTQ